MSLFLMGIHRGIGFALFAISMGLYYAIPAQFAGEGVFLTETVITPQIATCRLIPQTISDITSLRSNAINIPELTSLHQRAFLLTVYLNALPLGFFTFAAQFIHK